MCCCSVGIGVMRSCAVFVSQTGFLPSFLPFRAAALNPDYLTQNTVSAFCGLSCPSHDPTAPRLSNRGFSTAFLLPLQRCQCHRCFVSPLSESCRSRSGTSTRRVLSWLPSTRLSIPAGPATRTSNASSTGRYWSERRPGTQAHTHLQQSVPSGLLLPQVQESQTSPEQGSVSFPCSGSSDITQFTNSILELLHG